jgi:hypothetical protein
LADRPSFIALIGPSIFVLTLRSSLVENLMYRLKTLTGNCLWARRIGSQLTEVATRVGVLNRMTALARPQSVRIA